MVSGSNLVNAFIRGQVAAAPLLFNVEMEKQT